MYPAATEASPEQSLKQCQSTGDSDRIDKLSGMVQGLEDLLLGMKKDISFQVRVSFKQSILQYMQLIGESRTDGIV